MQLGFGFCYNQLESPNFESFHQPFMAMGSAGHLASQFPWFLPVSIEPKDLHLVVKAE